MHSPAPVTVEVGRSARLAAGMASCWLIGALLCGYGWFAHGETVYWHGLAALAGVVISGCVLVWHWHFLPCGQLTWDGIGWAWQANGVLNPGASTGVIQCELDLQTFLLLRLRPDQGPQLWLWLDRRMGSEPWIALRRALAARSKSAQATAAQDGAIAT